MQSTPGGKQSGGCGAPSDIVRSMQSTPERGPAGPESGKTCLPSAGAPGDLQRRLTLWPATALNMVDMIGVGPFATLPLMVSAMHGPQAIYGWIAGAALAVSDG